MYAAKGSAHIYKAQISYLIYNLHFNAVQHLFQSPNNTLSLSTITNSRILVLCRTLFILAAQIFKLVSVA